MTTNLCPTCHTPIPASAPAGLCPACILRDAEEPASHIRSVPDLAQVAAAFTQLDNIALIGQGGMGFVYQARQPSLDRTVALKILAPGLSRDPAFAERFAREARVLGKLNHPNIVTVFEHGVAQASGGSGTPPLSSGEMGTSPTPPAPKFYYLLMEHVDGVNLRQAMRAGRFTPAQALAIVPGICDALQAAHAQGIWHRDIKPENILLDAQGRVKIADFGIARILGDPARDFTLTATGAALGSAAYMAPEQHERPHDVDHRADIYSLGVVIYELLTGELPLGRFPAPSQRAEVNARIDEIVFRTLEKERALRQQSATEVKTEIENVAPDFNRQRATNSGDAAFSSTTPGGLKSGTTFAAAPSYVSSADRERYRSEKDVWIAYLLWFLVGVCGGHRFYLNQIGLGLLYFFTGGLFFIGWLVDLFLIPSQIRKHNERVRELNTPGPQPASGGPAKVVPDFSRQRVGTPSDTAFPNAPLGHAKSGMDLLLASKIAVIVGPSLFLAAAFFTHGNVQGVLLTIATTAFVVGSIGLLFGGPKRGGKSVERSDNDPRFQ